MNATHARAITDTAKELPDDMREIFRQIHSIADYGHDEIYFKELADTQYEYLKKYGYYLKRVKHVFESGNPPREAIKISW